MKTTDIIKDIMRKKEIRHTVLADRLEIKSNTLSERIAQTNISVLKLREMLCAMDYKITIVPRNARLPEDGYEVTFDNEPAKLPQSAPVKESNKKIKLSSLSREELETIVAEYTKEMVTNLLSEPDK